MRKVILTMAMSFLSLFIAQAALAAAPVLDPISDQEIYLNNNNVYIPVGVTDTEGRTISLSVSGANYVSLDVKPSSVPGRLNAVVRIKGLSTVRTDTLSLTATVSGASITKTIQVASLNSGIDDSILFEGIKYQRIVATRPFTTDFIVNSGSATQPIQSYTYTAPPGVSIPAPSLPVYQARASVIWTPTSGQTGFHDINVEFTRADGRKGKATIRLEVIAMPINSGSPIENAAPTLDPMSDQEVYFAKTTYVPAGAIDPEGENMDLFVTGIGVGAFTPANSGGRVSTTVPLTAAAGPGVSTSYVTIVAKDASRSVAIKQMKLVSNNTALDDAITFEGIKYQRIVATQAFTTDFIVNSGSATQPIQFLTYSAPPGVAIPAPTLPAYQARASVIWIPSADQTGFHDITIHAIRADGVSATATIRLEVIAMPINSGSPIENAAPTLDPMSDQEVYFAKTTYVPAGAIDPEGENMDLFVTGIGVGAFTPANSGGRVSTTVPLTAAAGPGVSTSYVTIVAKDASRSVAIKQMKLVSNNTALDDAITFEGIKYQRIVATQAFTTDFIVNSGSATQPIQFLTYSAPPGVAIPAPTLPAYQARASVIWIPSADQTGFHDITIHAIRADGVSATATIRLEVIAMPINSGSPIENAAPALDQVSDQEVFFGGTLNAPVGAIDSEGENMDLFVTGIGVGAFTPANSGGHASATVPLTGSAGPGASTSYVTIVAKDASRSVAIKQMKLVSNNTGIDSPISFDGISSQTIYVNQSFSLGFIVASGSTDSPINLFTYTSPVGASVNNSSLPSHSVSSNVSWTPTQLGIFDINILVGRQDGVTATATIRLKVAPPPVCGNGVVESPETCDDGNTVSGDGCSSVCKTEGGGHCYIATAAYGTQLEPQVQSLRNYRDTALLKDEAGSEFVDWYYHTSPPIANELKKHDGLRQAVRAALTPVVKFTEWYMNK